MKKVTIGFSMALVLAAVLYIEAGSLFTDVASHSAPKMVSEMNTALDALEDNIDGTIPLASPSIKGTLTAISTNSATTNVIITVNGVVDGETIGDDTIDDDSIDWSDVTAADITFAEGDITDSTIISADIKDGEIANADISASAAIASSKLAQDVCRIGDTSNTNQLFQSGNVTMHTGTIWTQTFDTAYADTPIVVANYTENPGDVQPLYVTSATTVDFTLTVTADKNFNWISLGRKQ